MHHVGLERALQAPGWPCSRSFQSSESGQQGAWWLITDYLALFSDCCFTPYLHWLLEPRGCTLCIFSAPTAPWTLVPQHPFQSSRGG